MEGTIQTAKELAGKLNGNYIQVIKKNGKTHDKLFKDPQRAVRAVGVENIKYLREVLKEQVNSRYTEIDAVTGTKENEL